MFARKADPRCEIGAYVSQGCHLYEVVGVDGETVLLENCRNGSVLSTTQSVMTHVASTYLLVKRAPTQAPDSVPDDLISQT